jgi:lipopolysaccharide biosynthesis regulator YciM
VIRNATVVLESQPGNAEALLIRGLALATDEEWQSAVEDLAASGKAGEDPRQAEALLSAYVELERWTEASAFLASLSDAIRNQPPVQDLARQVERNEN